MNYDLRLLRRDGALVCLIRTEQWNDHRARGIVDGMRLIPFDRFEIWRDDVLLLSRERYGEVGDEMQAVEGGQGQGR
jgi:hypothetical protein